MLLVIFYCDRSFVFLDKCGQEKPVFFPDVLMSDDESFIILMNHLDLVKN